jgi:protein-S-isoprenylcysteine O-methyltransferase Ste14
MTKKAAIRTSSIFTYTGLGIYIGWIILMVAINDMYLRNHLGLMLSPIALGAILLSMGISGNINNFVYRVLFILLSAIALTYLSYWVLAFLFIGKYGFGA